MPRNPRPIKNILKYSGKVASLLTLANEQRALLERVRAVSDIQTADSIVAALARGSVLILYAESPAWASRLRFTSRILLQKLSKTGERYQKVTVRVSAAKPAKKSIRLKRRELSAQNSRLIADAAASLDDDALSAALKRLARHKRT